MELDETHEKIINATFKILQTEGIEKVTTKKIATEANVNEVTIFRKFKTKNNLIEVAKEYYVEIFIKKLEDIFDFTGEEEIEEYLNRNFQGILNLSETDFNLIKIAIEEVNGVPEKKSIHTRISNTILGRLESFFKLQVEKGKIRDIDPKVLSVMCFSMTFQSVVLLRIYDSDQNIDRAAYREGFFDVFFNGIKP